MNRTSLGSENLFILVVSPSLPLSSNSRPIAPRSILIVRNPLIANSSLHLIDFWNLHPKRPSQGPPLLRNYRQEPTLTTSAHRLIKPVHTHQLLAHSRLPPP